VRHAADFLAVGWVPQPGHIVSAGCGEPTTIRIERGRPVCHALRPWLFLAGGSSHRRVRPPQSCSRPVAVSHYRVVPSSLKLTSRVPSGLNAVAWIGRA
jgi:hypothetical protein